MNEEKIQEVFSDEEYVKSLMELETPEEVQKALAEKDIDLSIEEINQIAELVRKKANGELTDEDLENVTGGCAGCVALVVTAIAVSVVALASNVVKRIFRRW